jgi:two-component system OmpR family sensor kinase
MGRLFWKILLAFWLALIATAVATAVVVSLQREAREPDLDRAAAALRQGGEDGLRAWMRETRRREGPVLFVVNSQGEELLGRRIPRPALERGRVLEAADGSRYLFYVAERRGRQRAGPPPAWLLAAMGAAASLAVSALLAWYLARPIRSLRWAFHAAAEGRLETRVRPLLKGRRDEIADLGDDFDQMAEQLQKLVAAQRRLLHDVSHELRSPLARLQAAIGLVRQDPAKLEASLERIEREVARLDALVGEVLTLARLESGTAGGMPQALDLADLVASIAADARFEAEAARRTVRLESADKVPVFGRAELLHRAVENVIRNAVKYTAEGSAVEIALSAAGGRALLAVRDHGPGIPPAEIHRVFEPFYRASGSAAAGGFGLGLAIARRAIATHGGSIRARNAEGGGLQVEIELPLAG